MSQPGQPNQDRQPLPSAVMDEILRYQSKLRRAERLLETANDAARAVQVPFTTFILLGTYIGIIIASTTDEQLLRISPVTLPLLNVELPILSFYLFAPWLFLLLHFNLLLYLALLERQLRLFEQFVTQLPEAEAAVLRQRLYNFPFIHMLIGRQYDRFMRLVLALIVWITVIALPLGLLLWAQIAFLPYHDPYITWGQRAAVALDAAILVLFWSRIVSTKSALAWWRQCSQRAWARLSWWLALPWAVLRHALRLPGKPLPKPWAGAAHEEGSGAGFLLVTAITAILASLLIATVPEERWEQALVGRLPQTWIYHDEVNNRRFLWPTYALFEAEGAVLSRNLTLREQVLTVNELPAEVINILREGQVEEQQQALRQVLGINLQGRDLRYAKLSKSILPKADLREAELQAAELRDAQLQGANVAGAQLQGAVLRDAQLQGADLTRAQLQGADLRWAQLQGADLRWAQLQGADLIDAQLQGADLRQARLQGANLSLARLQAANLRWAELQNANLRQAQLQGADLRQAQLQGAGLAGVQLQGADLRWAQLQGANLAGAQLQGADLAGAQLQGAVLFGAQLQGADLDGAQLQGADLAGAQLQGAVLFGAQLQGADLAGAQLQGADLRRAQIGGASFQQAQLDLADLRGIDRTAPTEGQYEVLRRMLEAQVDDGEFRAHILQRFEAAMNAQEANLEEVSIAQPCLSAVPKLLPGCVTEEQLATHGAALTSYLVTLACSDRDVARGVARRVVSDRDRQTSLALLEASCPPIIELAEAIKDQLVAISSH